MGNGGSIQGFGIAFQWMSANPADREKIDCFIKAAGFEKAKQIFNENPELKKAMDDYGCSFPEWEAELELWYDIMTPEQGAAIVAAFEKVQQ